MLEIDVEGTLSILARYPEAVTIFVEPSHPDQLLERLRARGTESPEAMARRLEVAHRELLQSHHYRHRVVNDDDIAAAVTTIQRILFDAGLPDPTAHRHQQQSSHDKPDIAPHTPSGAQT